jgi:hepA/SNF2 family protein
MPGYLYPYGKFKNNFERKIVLENDPYTVNRLKQMVKPFVLRRLKSNVLSELPEKVESVLSARLEEEQRELYLANLMSLKETVKNMPDQEFRSNKIQVLALLTRLRQICCSPTLVAENYSGNDAKLNMLMELVESGRDSGHKMLVFSQFTSMLGLIGGELKARGIDYYLLQGDTPKQDRMQMVEKFNRDSVPVFLISLKAGGTGLNLTGADMVIHYDPWWNMSVQNQATDRAYRLGQKNSVQVYKLILEDTVEEKIVELQEKKSELSDLVIQEGEHFITGMNKEELLKLMEM